MVDNFLALSGKLVFPSAVPFRFILPPRIAKPTSFVSPVPNASFSALGDHVASAEATLARKIGLSFLAFSVYESKFHDWTWPQPKLRDRQRRMRDSVGRSPATKDTASAHVPRMFLHSRHKTNTRVPCGAPTNRSKDR